LFEGGAKVLWASLVREMEQAAADSAESLEAQGADQVTEPVPCEDFRQLPGAPQMRTVY
jgi:hypothetical protein